VLDENKFAISKKKTSSREENVERNYTLKIIHNSGGALFLIKGPMILKIFFIPKERILSKGLCF